ncbi:anti-sigma-I factor RsgI family protein [Clostridium sp. UBA3887]|uniref:anti-sigma-I factor RsgI family protein n=1 Tax=Clostridium sp. UBA3887 TaxID=1946356 RepID=UPI0032165BDF
MKSVVVEIKAGYAAVLSEDGCISKVKDKNYIIGQVIEMKSSNLKNINKLVMCSALTAMIAIVGGITLWAYKTPYSYVSLDVNPSIEYSLNRFDKVISVTAVNDDGQEILNELELNKLENQKIEDAVAETVNQISEDGYFDNSIDNDIDGGIIIATSGENQEKSDELAEKLQESLETEIEEIGEDITLETISVGFERVQKAKELGVTPGKLNLVEKLQNSSSNPESIILEEWLNKPVKEIMSAIKENKKAKIEQTETSDEDESTEESTTEVADEIKTDKALTKEAENTNDTKATQERSSQKSQNKIEKATNKLEKTENKANKKSEVTEKKNSNNAEKPKEKIPNKPEKSKEKTPNKPENPGKKGN